VIGAIQVMGMYPWASRKADDWVKSLGEPLSATEWPTIFREHPEIFRFTKQGWASLRWRHGYFRTFDARRGCDLSEADRAALTSEQQEDLTHRPLTVKQIEALIKTAMELHTRAIAHANERRWSIPLLLGLISAVLAFFGAILGAWIKG